MWGLEIQEQQEQKHGDGPYRECEINEPGGCFWHRHGWRINRGLVIFAAVVSLVAGGWWLGAYFAPEERVVVEEREPEEPDLTHREIGCIAVCKPNGVQWFTRNDHHGYVCMCEGAEKPIDPGTVKQMLDD